MAFFGFSKTVYSQFNFHVAFFNAAEDPGDSFSLSFHSNFILFALGE